MKAEEEMRAEQSKERERRQAQEDAYYMQAKEREGRQGVEEAIKQAKERAAKLDKMKMAKGKEAVKQAKERAAKEAKDKDAKREEGVRLDQQDERVNKLIEETRLLREELERETLERKEGEKKQNKKIDSLAHTLDFGIRLFKDYMLRRQYSSCRCSMHPCRCQPQILGYDQRVKLLTHFELPKDDDKDLDNILDASYSSLEDKSNHSFEATEFFEQQNGETDPENEGGTTLLDLNYELFEDGQESSEMTPTNNEGTQAKEKGNAYFKEQKFEKAIECYSRSIVLLPTAATYGNRAMAYIELNKFIEAEKDCTDALKIDDQYFKAYARRAMARTKLGCDLQGALDDVRVALRLESNNQEMEKLYAKLVSMKAATEAKEEGNTLFKHKNFTDAIISYSRSIDRFPTAVAYSNRAMAYLMLNKPKEAENDCSKALKIDDQYFKAYARRAIARSKLGCNLEGAFGDVEVALKFEPDNLEMKKLQGKLIRELG
ncbi:hypothetical protein KSS87_009633 [Heliosperma pusillum]|nr:hypothetical protein KSS87_009633 [Heliosperma pusillum]